LNYFLKIDSKAKYEIYVPCSANVGSASPSSTAGRNVVNKIYVLAGEN
jgi:hypothetical protein